MRGSAALFLFRIPSTGIVREEGSEDGRVLRSHPTVDGKNHTRSTVSLFISLLAPLSKTGLLFGEANYFWQTKSKKEKQTPQLWGPLPPDSNYPHKGEWPLSFRWRPGGVYSKGCCLTYERW